MWIILIGRRNHRPITVLNLICPQTLSATSAICRSRPPAGTFHAGALSSSALAPAPPPATPSDAPVHHLLAHDERRFRHTRDDGRPRRRRRAPSRAPRHRRQGSRRPRRQCQVAIEARSPRLRLLRRCFGHRQAPAARVPPQVRERPRHETTGRDKERARRAPRDRTRDRVCVSPRCTTSSRVGVGRETSGVYKHTFSPTLTHPSFSDLSTSV